MTPDTTPVDPSRCPLCGEANRCGAESGAGTCWCYSVQIPDEVLNRLPPAGPNRACICQKCASAHHVSDANGQSEPSSA
ncbi:MAG: cysteine-rich CWC family protein [Acidimicrobiia bacterium]|nr:cysteine-rich CWC family protein [Acidimicrobiia bacterium]